MSHIELIAEISSSKDHTIPHIQNMISYLKHENLPQNVYKLAKSLTLVRCDEHDIKILRTIKGRKYDTQSFMINIAVVTLKTVHTFQYLARLMK